MECNYTHSSAFQIAKLPSSSPHTNELLRQKKKKAIDLPGKTAEFNPAINAQMVGFLFTF